MAARGLTLITLAGSHLVVVAVGIATVLAVCWMLLGASWSTDEQMVAITHYTSGDALRA